MVCMAVSSRAAWNSAAPIARATFEARIVLIVESPAKTGIEAPML